MEMLEAQEVKFEPLLAEIKAEEEELMKRFTESSSKLRSEINNAFDKKTAILVKDKNSLLNQIDVKEKTSLEDLNRMRISNDEDKMLIRSSSSIESAKEITLKIKKNLAQTFKSKWTKERFVPMVQFESRRSNLIGYFDQEGDNLISSLSLHDVGGSEELIANLLDELERQKRLFENLVNSKSGLEGLKLKTEATERNACFTKDFKDVMKKKAS
jgi:hypothetical protein